MDGFFGIGFLELVLVAIIALIVMGPERLPGAMREGARYLRQLRKLGQEFSSQFSEELKILDEVNPRRILSEMTDPNRPDPDAKPDAKPAAKPAPKPIAKPAASGPGGGPPATTTRTAPAAKPLAPAPAAAPAVTAAQEMSDAPVPDKQSNGAAPSSAPVEPGENSILPPRAVESDQATVPGDGSRPA